MTPREPQPPGDAVQTTSHEAMQPREEQKDAKIGQPQPQPQPQSGQNETTKEETQASAAGSSAQSPASAWQVRAIQQFWSKHVSVVVDFETSRDHLAAREGPRRATEAGFGHSFWVPGHPSRPKRLLQAKLSSVIPDPCDGMFFCLPPFRTWKHRRRHLSRAVAPAHSHIVLHFYIRTCRYSKLGVAERVPSGELRKRSAACV
ncbi:hypothetical protein CSUB01_03417 [Colletotrichum sublineola]|uniref:Uncharacterized protein n=1 Tax=Colletotrichum sublineola TaxID=1173701 RepID=A0A066XLI4_COLSU|nr:hypothetical protein CSUB01_03417 [Colletotrichum sublineola]